MQNPWEGEREGAGGGGEKPQSGTPRSPIQAALLPTQLPTDAPELAGELGDQCGKPGLSSRLEASDWPSRPGENEVMDGKKKIPLDLLERQMYRSREGKNNACPGQGRATGPQVSPPQVPTVAEDFAPRRAAGVGQVPAV